jgi:hypothetical protein
MMSEIIKNGGGFVAYEYKEILVRPDVKSLYEDCYPSFGWILEGNSSLIPGISSVSLKFKRSRKIRNKAELTRLQRQFESSVKEIENWENSKAVKAQIIAFTIGIIGVAFIAGSVFASLRSLIPLMVILAIPGFAGWVLSYFCYTRILKKRIDTVTPLIEQQYDAIAETCEKANSLLDKEI